jgi:sucrose phosphorylase
LRNTSKAFLGTGSFEEITTESINILWTNGGDYARLEGNLKTLDFSVRYSEMGEEKVF